jgi:hypothetical protein
MTGMLKEPRYATGEEGSYSEGYSNGYEAGKQDARTETLEAVKVIVRDTDGEYAILKKLETLVNKSASLPARSLKEEEEEENMTDGNKSQYLTQEDWNIIGNALWFYVGANGKQKQKRPEEHTMIRINRIRAILGDLP